MCANTLISKREPVSTCSEQVGIMGDTVFAIQGDGFVLMGADTSANQSIIRMKTGEDKILEASSHMILVGFHQRSRTCLRF